MALKRRIKKEEFEKLPELFQKEYVEKDGEYELDVDGIEDTGKLKRALDREREEAKKNKERAEELERKLNEGVDLDARKKGDIETLERSWEAKYKKLDDTKNGEIAKLKSFAEKTLREDKAKAIAAEIAKPESVRFIARDIQDRLKVDFDGETPTVKVLDTNGQLSALTVDELKKEVLTSADYSHHIIGSKASGSGATTGERKNGSAGDNDGKPINLSTAKPSDLAARIEAKKEAQNQS